MAAGLVVVFAIYGSAVALQVYRDHALPRPEPTVQELYLSSGDAARKLALSYKALLADVYWIRAVQYFGRTRLQGSANPSYDLLYPLLDITTSLDPAFNIAYRFGAIFLSEAYPHGPGRPDLAVKLLDKGFEQNPHKWEYLYDKAFVYYWSYKDPERAAHWFSEAAKVPGSAEWLPGLAAFMLSQTTNRQRSRVLWAHIYRTAEHEYMRVNAEWRLQQLDAMDALDRLNPLLDRYARETGSRASSWVPLIRRGWLRGEPLDPTGVPFVIGEDGRAAVSRDSTLHPLPIETAPQKPSDRPASSAAADAAR
ncbi:MAG TPA: hypothetical protein VNK41_02925 [Vicinamibacterales bacterium]|nr:hypothetical protein [Vicinamibacterales bacterium]